MRTQFIVLAVSTFLFGCQNQSSNKNKIDLLVRLESIKKINLYENIKQIGKIRACRVSKDFGIYILDSRAGSIVVYDTSGFQRKVISRYGEGPAELHEPLSFAINNNFIFVPEYYRGIKFFCGDSILKKNILVGDNNFSLINGDIHAMNDSILFLSCIWDGKQKKSEIVAAFIDTSGLLVKLITGYPSKYEDFMLSSEKICAIANNGFYTISFIQSPDLIIGHFKDADHKIIHLDDRGELYISPKRRPDSGNRMSEILALTKEEWINYRTLFLSDTLLIRTRSLSTKESIRLKSLVVRQNHLDIFTKEGEFIGDVPLPGRLHDCFQDMLLIEESDEPDNRRFGLYEVKFTTQK